MWNKYLYTNLDIVIPCSQGGVAPSVVTIIGISDSWNPISSGVLIIILVKAGSESSY